MGPFPKGNPYFQPPKIRKKGACGAHFLFRAVVFALGARAREARAQRAQRARTQHAHSARAQRARCRFLEERTHISSDPKCVLCFLAS